MSDRESGGADAGSAPAVVVREARPADADAVAAFTRDTWGERHDDYIPRVFPEWAASDDPDRETFVATLPSEAVADSDAATERDDREPGDTLVEGDGAGAAAPGDQEAVVGCIQGVLLSEWESWGQGIRVDPAARGFGVGTALSTAALEWAREQGATICRNMVFSWNVMGLGQSRAVDFEPATEFRFAEPAPNARAVPDAGATDSADSTDAAGDVASDGFSAVAVADPDPNAAWAFWTDSDARDHLRGLALDPGESWACSALTRDRLRTAADEGRLLAVAEAPANPGAGRGPIAGFAVRTRTSERPAGDGDSDDDSDDDDDADSTSDGDADTERVAEYGVSAWRDVDAAGVLYQSIAADAAEAGADATRVLIPETVEHVSDTGANRVPVAAEPDFVMSADLTGSGSGSGASDAGDAADVADVATDDL